MAGITTYLARAGLAAGGAALIALWFSGATGPQSAWFAAVPEIHIFAIALLGNLLFVACPFRRRSDLALGLAIIVAGIDIAARAPLNIGFADAAGIVLVMLPVWAGKLRHRTHKERRQRMRWRSASRHPQAHTGVQTDLEADLNGENWIVAR